jgi:hypothetical protein
MNPNAAAFAMILKMRQNQPSLADNEPHQHKFSYNSNFVSQPYGYGNRDLNIENSLHYNQSLLNNNNIHELKTVKNDLFADTVPQISQSLVHKENKWYCKLCEKHFNQNATYISHCKSHEKCKHPGCDFMATRKILDVHFVSVHGQYSGTGFKTIDIEGQKFKVLMGTVPEEVNEWRESRKRKFPSAHNTTVKQQASSLFVEQGGVLDQSKRTKNTQPVLCGPKSNREDKISESSPPLQLSSHHSTLFKKLLNDEIIIENNFILQCIHFLVQQNFLEGQLST